MGTAFKTFFSTLTMLLEALQHGVQAISYLMRWSEETAGSFYDESRRERLARANQATEVPLLAKE